MNKNESKYFRTALKMDDALVQLLDEKSFEYITVKDICKKAKVNRSTFYLHYSNTMDCLEEILENLSASYSEHMHKSKNVIGNISKSNLRELYLISDDFLIPYLSFVKENKNIYMALKSNPLVFKVDKTYKKMFDDVFSPIMARFGLEKKWHRYMMDFYSKGLSSIMIDWVVDGCETPVEEVAAFIESLIVKYDKEGN